MWEYVRDYNSWLFLRKRKKKRNEKLIKIEKRFVFNPARYILKYSKCRRSWQYSFWKRKKELLLLIDRRRLNLTKYTIDPILYGVYNDVVFHAMENRP